MVVSRTNDSDYLYERSLVLVDVATGAWRELTPGRRNVDGVEWSPSGDRLAFVDREADEKSQLYVLPIDGGEARRITDAKRGVIRFAWRPDGQAFAFLTEDEPVGRTGEEKHDKSFEVDYDTYLDQPPSLPTRGRRGEAHHLWSPERHVGRVDARWQAVVDERWATHPVP
jgi:dipeptidyl aminopeptidase/acylaminoacyl peptidase